MAQKHGQLGNWLQGLDRDQDHLSWWPTDDCLSGQRSRAVLRLDVY